MKALQIAPGGALRIAELPLPQLRPGEALVRVCAAGLNRADVSQRLGKYPAPPDVPPDIPGLEFSGIVEQGARFAAGQRVFGLVGGGAQAQFVACPETLLLPVPAQLTDQEAAAIPEAYITAHDALIVQAGLQPGERVLIHAVASGVGLAALGIARSRRCFVAGTSRSPDKLERVRALGIDAAMTPEDFDRHVLRATNGAGVDVILDPIGGSHLERNFCALAMRGRLVVISTMGGADARLSLATLMRKRLSLFGTTLRNRSLEEKTQAVKAFERDVLPLLASHQIRVCVSAVYQIEEAAAAYEAMQANRTFGKIVFALS